MGTDQTNSTDGTVGAGRGEGRRHLGVVPFLLLTVVYLVIIQGVGKLTESQVDEPGDRVLSVADVWWTFLLPLGLALVFVYGIITVLGWWRVVLHDPKPVQRWVWVIPVIFIVAIAAGINYGGLADRGLGFTAALFLAAMFVGFGEEGMFRAVGVNTFRQAGLTEAKVALWSSVVFGAVHLSNAIGAGAKSIFQALVVAFAGYFFYLIRRVSRSNILNSVLHGLFDFTILTSTVILPVGEDQYVLGSLLPIIVYPVCGIILLVRRHHIEPTDGPARPVTAP